MTEEKVKALLIKVGEAPKEIEIENDFRALQKAVGGLIEFYPVIRLAKLRHMKDMLFKAQKPYHRSLRYI